MKKLISLLLAIIMLISLAVPVFAASEFKTDPETGETYEEFTFNFDEFDFNATIEGKQFNIEADYHSETGVYGGKNGKATKIYTKEGNDDIIARVEARVSSYPSAYDKIGVKPGNKREATIGRNEMAHIDNINSKEFAFDGGTDYVGFDLIRVYFECDHVWGENGKCEYCGVLKCEATGEHSAVCAYCGKELSEEVIPSQNATGSTISEGNVSVIVGIACAAVFGLGGYLLGSKKKKEKA